MFLINLLVCHILLFTSILSDQIRGFLEQEITGDVLLDLDVNLLKTEIGIPAFGKRMRIANAITDLRRPPSVIYSDHAPTQSQSTTQSQPQSYGYSHARAQSIQSSVNNSLNSPMYAGGFNGLPSAGYGSMMTSESAPQTSEIPSAARMEKEQRRVSDPASSAGVSLSVTDTDEKANGSSDSAVRTALMIGGGMAGLGLGVPTNGFKNRPAQLSLSPSDNNLRSNTRAVGGNIPEEVGDDELVVMSDVSVLCSCIIRQDSDHSMSRTTQRLLPPARGVAFSGAPLNPAPPLISVIRW